MKVPYSWLKDFVDINVSPEVLADKMVKAGFEVEEIINLADSYKKIVVGVITEISKHPDADKLIVCQIDCGSYGIKQIVTHANNVKVGDYVPTCLHGAVLPDGKTITKGKLRGVVSEGMMCGGSELGLTEDDYEGAGVDGIFILDDRCEKGTDINVYLDTLDYVLDIGVTANRPDCNSIVGIAREVAAVLDLPFNGVPCEDYQETGDISDYVDVKVLDEELCPRYMAKAVKNVKIARSPELIRRRLRKVGIRPINNIVDITNYVLTEIGQPMHSFDADVLGKEIVVRRAQDGERIITLDGKENVLNSENLVICDSQKPVALAGIMGGLNSGITDDTTTVIFESARFKRDNIRRSSKALGIRSDSSARFEKGVDFASQAMAVERICSMIAEQGIGDIVGGVRDTYQGGEEQILKVSANKINSILGIEIPAETMVSYLNRLSMSATLENDVITLKVPSFREDILNANDVAEEVIRLLGYDNIVSTPLDGLQQTHGGLTQVQRLERNLKALLSGASGFSECVSYSFVSPSFVQKLRIPEGDYRRDYIELINPLGEELSVMRTTLLHSMMLTLNTNNSRGNKRVRLYEIGKVYIPKSLPITDYADERPTLMLAEMGETDFFSLKRVLETISHAHNVSFDYKPEKFPWLHPGRSAAVYIGEEYIGYIGEVHPEVAKEYKLDQRVIVSELSLDKIFQASKDHLPYVDLPKFPATTRDLAFVLDSSIPAGELLAVVKKAGGKLLESAKIFDVYNGKGIITGKKSVAVALSFRAKDRTLTDDEVNVLIDKILNQVKEKLNGVLR